MLTDQNAVDELQAHIDAIDFDGGPASAGTVVPAASTQDPPAADPKADGEPTRTPDPKLDPTPVSDDGVADTEADPEPTRENGDGGEEDGKPALPDSHYRAAIRMGMTTEEISELYDQSPATAVKTLAKCYEMVNKTSQQLGALGRAVHKNQTTVPNAPAQPAQESPPDARINKLIERIRDHYDSPDDPMAEVLIEVLKDRAQPKPQPQAQPSQPEIPGRSLEEEIAARQQINVFFGSEDLEPYQELYGSNSGDLGDWRHLSQIQRDNRVEVCERAQMILYGAAATGMEMSTAEALERAHFEIAAPMAEEVVRNRMITSAKKRERGLTLKPNGSRSLDRSGDSKFNKKEAVDEVASKLREVFAA